MTNGHHEANTCSDCSNNPSRAAPELLLFWCDKQLRITWRVITECFICLLITKESCGWYITWLTAQWHTSYCLLSHFHSFLTVISFPEVWQARFGRSLVQSNWVHNRCEDQALHIGVSQTTWLVYMIHCHPSCTNLKMTHTLWTSQFFVWLSLKY